MQKVFLCILHNPLFYYRDIFTGVCETNECKPVRLTLFWDISGSFLGFQVPDDYPLTKVDHVLESLSTIKCLIISNYLNRQKYVYPEAQKKLSQCKRLNDTFLKMIGSSKRCGLMIYNVF